MYLLLAFYKQSLFLSPAATPAEPATDEAGSVLDGGDEDLRAVVSMLPKRGKLGGIRLVHLT